MAREIDKDTLWSEIERKHALAQPRDREPDAVADAPSAPVQPPSEPPTTNAVDAMAPAAEADNGAQAPPAPVASEPVEPVTPRETDAAAIARLAAMGQLDYDRVRRQQAQALGVSVQTLDAEVRAARARQAPADDGMPFADPVPWPEPVDPAELLDEIAQTIRRFVVMDPEAGYATALWNVQTHVADCFDTASILANTSAEPGSGKTTLASTVARICHRPLLASHASPSSIFRAVEKWRPTLIIDEGDTFLRHNPELHGLLNAGHGRGGFVLRTVAKDDDFEPRAFDVFGLKLVSGNALRRHLPATTLTRCIIIDMHRRRPNEPVERLRDADPATFDRIKAKIARFKLDYAEQLRSARPRLPDELSDRAQDNWAPLFAIAECAGPLWVDRATKAALKLSGGSEAQASIGNMLLSDVRRIFDRRPIDKISSADLIDELCRNDERPWATYNRGKQITPRQLARLLSAYGVRSKTVRLGPSNTPKGFERAQFDDAFGRYLPSPEQQTRSDPPAPAHNSDAGDWPDEVDPLDP